jgi:putative tryptophan/tyrosine transport system substrate-binding protein
VQRREFLGVVGGAATWPLAARAQQAERIRRIGLLQGLAADDPVWQPRFAAFQQRLQEFGWVEGRNLAFEFRYAEGRSERLTSLAADLVRANVDIIVTNAAEPVAAAQAATSSVPIVMASVGDAIGSGFIKSLARPGGNTTGLTLIATVQSAKRLELIKEFVPGLVRAAAFWNGNAIGHQLAMKEMTQAASMLGIELQSLPIRNSDDIDPGFRSLVQANAQAIISLDDPLVQSNRMRIVELALQHRLPVMGEFKAMPAAGGLVSYGPDQVDMWRRAAAYVDKILRGANPAELPVEQPAKFELVINLKTAKALGLEIPPTLLARADEVIE